MKSLIAILTVLAIAISSASVHADNFTAEQIRKEIVGQWRLLSFEHKGKVIDDYSSNEVVWRFTDDNTAFISEPV